MGKILAHLGAAFHQFAFFPKSVMASGFGNQNE
jgi:hypothetical protein